MPSTDYMELSYPIHFLKSSCSVILEYRHKQVNILRDAMLFIHYPLQIKQHIYSKGILRVPVVTKCIVKEYRKVLFLKSYDFTFSIF